MADKKKKTGVTGAGWDAYDDFLDGIDTPASSGKTAAKKASASKASAKSSSGKPKASFGKSSAAKTAAKTPVSSAQKEDNASTVKKTTSGNKSGGRKKNTKVEEGIVSLGSRSAGKANQAVSSAKGNSTARKKAVKVEPGIASIPQNSAPRRAGYQVQNQQPENRKRMPVKPAAAPVSKPVNRRNGSVMAVSGPVKGKNPHRSDDDIFMEKPAAPAHKRSGGSGKRSDNSGKAKKAFSLNGWDIFFSAGIICVLALVFWQSTQYSSFLVMKNAVDRQTFYPGTTVEGVDVSSMTLNDALTYWEDHIESRYASRTVQMDNGNTISARELGYSSDYAMVLANAWNAGRSGSLEERYEAISTRQDEPVAYSVSRVPYSEAALNQYVQMVAQQVNKPASEPSIKSFNLSTFKFEFTDPQAGSRLDEEALKKALRQSLDAGGGNVQLVVNAIQPTTTKEAVASQYGMITSAITNASSSSSNRLQNIKLSLQLINGTCLKPGESFSFNKVVGERTKARGFKEATAYSSGEVTEQVGGGICQVSTTLFNAAVKADLEITERHNHSLTVAYVDLGKDATVNWPSQDLSFKNNTDDDIYICCYLTDDKRVRFGIFGKLLPNGQTITVEGVTTGTIAYETEYQASGLLLSGEQQVLQTGKNGFTAETYKIRWDANGNQISRELLCKSRYMAKKEIIQYGP